MVFSSETSGAFFSFAATADYRMTENEPAALIIPTDGGFLKYRARIYEW